MKKKGEEWQEWQEKNGQTIAERHKHPDDSEGKSSYLLANRVDLNTLMNQRFRS